VHLKAEEYESIFLPLFFAFRKIIFNFAKECKGCNKAYSPDGYIGAINGIING
jgi:hypothetical protein